MMAEWIEGAPTEPGWYWVVSAEDEDEPRREPRIMQFAADKEYPGGIYANSVGWECNLAILNNGEPGKFQAHSYCWIVAHQPITPPEPYGDAK